MTAGLRSEARLLLACARTRIDAAREDEIRALAERGIDWDYLVRKAEEHQLAPLLYRSLGAVCPGAVPGPALERLRRRFRANALHSMRLSAELVKLLRLFDAAGVQAIPLKGPTLAQAAYGDVTLREFFDLDILVRPRDVARAGEALLQRGYTPDIDLAGRQLSLALRSTKEQGFVRANGPMVEVHWRLTPPQLPPLMDFDSLWTRRTTLEINGYPASSFGAEDLLAYLFVHGGKHAWSSLGWLCDVLQLTEGLGEIPWREVADRARHYRCVRMLRLGVLLAAGLLGAQAPPQLLDEAAADPTVRDAADEIARRAFAEETSGESPWATYRGQAKLLDTTADRVRCWWNIFLCPQLAEWQAIPLPRSLFFLYYLLRPLRLLGRYALRGARRAR